MAKIDRTKARTWLLAELTAGRNDPGFAQRFYIWARNQADGSLGYNEGVELFLDLCRELHIRAEIRADDQTAYFVAGNGPKTGERGRSGL